MLRFRLFLGQQNLRRLRQSKRIKILFSITLCNSRYKRVYLKPPQNDWDKIRITLEKKIFTLQVPEHDISNQTLFLQVFDWDRFTKNDAVGEVKIQMGYVDLSRTVDEWRQLMKYSGKVSKYWLGFGFIFWLQYSFHFSRNPCLCLVTRPPSKKNPQNPHHHPLMRTKIRSHQQVHPKFTTEFNMTEATKHWKCQ